MEVNRNTPLQMIVMPDEILTEDQIRTEVPRYADISFRNNMEVIQWLCRRRLLHNMLICDDCHTPMSFIQRNDRIDGFAWKCKGCQMRCSIRKDSFFTRSHLSLQQLLFIIYGWSRDTPQQEIAHEAGLGSNHTIIDWCNFCRAVCEQHLIDNPEQLGGLNYDCTAKIVEIDELKYLHPKNHLGHWREGHWVFGGIESGSGKCFLVEVPDRQAETLTPIIEQYILPGSIILSDGSLAYKNINRINDGVYEHHVVAHQESLTDSIDDCVRRYYVENMWLSAKRKLRHQFGTTPELFPLYLYEFVWRNKFKGTNIFSEFVVCIAQQYPVYGVKRQVQLELVDGSGRYVPIERQVCWSDTKI